jgi:putative hemolysin
MIVILLILAVTANACSLPGQQNQTKNNADAGLANPASVYCIDQGGTLEMRQDADGGTYGVCIFPDGSECEEWAYFRGECQPGGQIDTPPEPAPVDPQPGPVSEVVVAWYGRVVTSGTAVPAESKLLIAPEGTGEVFVTGENGEIENIIISIRDKEPPGNYANFWGRLDCPNPEECLLTVTRIRLDGPGEFNEPDVIEAWEGTLVTTRTEPGSGGDDCIVISGMFEIEYGIHGADEGTNQLIEEYKDSGQTVRIWGQMTAGIPDWNGTQILVSRIELVE